MSAGNPRVFSIPAAAPFVPTLVRALIDGTLVDGRFGFAPARDPKARDPMALAGATLYLPTRRACRLVRDQFLDIAGGHAAIRASLHDGLTLPRAFRRAGAMMRRP